VRNPATRADACRAALAIVWVIALLCVGGAGLIVYWKGWPFPVP